MTPKAARGNKIPTLLVRLTPKLNSLTCMLFPDINRPFRYDSKIPVVRIKNIAMRKSRIMESVGTSLLNDCLSKRSGNLNLMIFMNIRKIYVRM